MPGASGKDSGEMFCLNEKNDKNEKLACPYASAMKAISWITRSISASVL